MSYIDLLITIACSVSIAAAWLLPGTSACAIFGIASACTIILLATRTARPYLCAYIAGILLHPFAFYWLFFTIRDFGGFSNVATGLIFALFCLLSAAQFPIYILFFKGWSKTGVSTGLACALAWTGAEMISVRIFPWYIGHTQLSILPLAQIADIGGASLISLLIVWGADSLINRSISRAKAITIFLVVLYGFVKMNSELTSSANIMLVQANISVDDKHSQKMLLTNVSRYQELTENNLSNDDLVIWPESVVMTPVYDTIRTSSESRFIPTFSKSTSLLTGIITGDTDRNLYNSAMVIMPDGTIPAPYHKQILMPFGEYTPFGDYLPWIREINSTAAEFKPGTAQSIYKVPTKTGEIKLSPLICYEDILPRLSRAAANSGAEILVNITNDAWFGESVAPRQHHLIASFRAIETRRTLVRSTNTGITAVVNPLGQTTATLPEWSDGVLKTAIYRPLEAQTIFMLIGEWPWYFISLASVLLIFRRKTLV